MADTTEILCIGAAHWDVIGASPERLAFGDDRPGTIRQRPGGVALNIALGLVALGIPVSLLAAIGRDPAGEALVDALSAAGVGLAHLHRPEDLPTDRYLAIEGAQGLIAAIADCHALEQNAERILAPLWDGALRDWSGTLVLDSGLPAHVAARLAATTGRGWALRLAAAASAKVTRLRAFLGTDATFYLNRAEVEALLGVRFPDSASAAQALITAGAQRALVTDGAQAATDANRTQTLTRRPLPLSTQSRVTGAGDAFMAAHIAAEAGGASRDAALDAALAGAAHHMTCP